MVEVLLKTDLRPGEAIGLRVRELDRERRRLTIRRDFDDLGRVEKTKTRQHRDVPVSQLTLLLLDNAAAGADVYVVQRMVGHTSSATTLSYYGHLWDEGLDQAAEAIERHLEAERARVDTEQVRREEREKAAGVRHLRVVK